MPLAFDRWSNEIGVPRSIFRCKRGARFDFRRQRPRLLQRSAPVFGRHFNLLASQLPAQIPLHVHHLLPQQRQRAQSVQVRAQTQAPSFARGVQAVLPEVVLR